MIELPQELTELLEDKGAVKILGTVNDKGIPHVVIKDSIRLLAGGNIAYAEELDSSKTNKNMVRSIWFNKVVSITVAKGKKCYQIKGRPFKCLITGPLFSEFLIRERERIGSDADIQAVWIITPAEVRDESRKMRKEEEMKKDPLYNIHLDKLKNVMKSSPL